MAELTFEWDARKNDANIKKHRISFEEAQTVFFDENAIEFFDPDHSKAENRFLLIGRSFKLRILIISYCYRQSEEVIRIISSRMATKKERMIYISGGN
ncbi:BrnT family toxin [bacterium]|nr:BrnT family toxin [bacterium]